MTKASKGNSMMAIFLGVALIIQVIILILGFLFWKDIESAKEYQEEVGAAASATWTVDYEEAKENETVHYKGYLLNAEQTVRSYWHSKDREFRLTVESEALKVLMSQKIVVVKESSAGEHLFLTAYYNPLRIKNPQPEDLTAIYQVVRYQKPEIAKMYDQKKLAITTEDKIEENEDLATGDESSTKENEVIEPTAKSSALEDLKYYYPFELETIVAETEEIIVFVNTNVELTETMLNYDSLSPYITKDSFHGDYGWEKGLFYQEDEPEKNPDEVTQSEDEEIDSDIKN